VAPEVKPFLSREINDELFKDLLYDEVDVNRVSITAKQIREIEFGGIGVPKIIVALWSFLSKEPID